MNSEVIRQKFLDYFASKGHTVVKSAPLVIKNDPILMFTNSGMVQFKDNFLGNATPKSKRIADTQKCLRVSGKHNDLEEVGIDTYHHTMFEMLGNWSFGDYFKKEAIEWAWELLTKEYKLPEHRLYVTVFGGDKDDNLPVDEEAQALWRAYVPDERILHGNKKDNFWEMADVGPCGPCSEIHIDLRSEEEIKKKPGRELVNQDHPQVIEIWNNVFMEFERYWNPAKGGAGALVKFDLEYKGEDKKQAREKQRSALTLLKPLPSKNVDTGMGFERLCMAIQGKTSNYDTDVFMPLIDFIGKAAGIKYKQDEKTDVAMRVIADHVRAVSFAIADGQLPSNNGAGYVIRRILRRAVRYGFNFLNFKEPFIYKLVAVLADQFATVFDELKAQEEFVAKVIHEEEVAFIKTLGNGLKRFEEEKERKKKEGSATISGQFAFELYDTFGFPIDLTQLIAREAGMRVDIDEFNKNMQTQKDRSRAAAAQETGDWVILKDDEVEFLGYDSLESVSEIIKYREVKTKDKKIYQIVLNKTPFYGESGGQVGDRGYIESNGEKIYVIDTKKENDLIIQYTEKLPSNLQASFKAVVDQKKRKLTENNHSATHLLHAALREVLGTHVAQKGSLVNEELLRFDFSHFTKMSDEEIKKVETIVNRKIRENIAKDEKRNVPIKQALEFGATALFGEKYGDFVRVITFDRNYSVELCGGTHVPATGNIGFFKIISEGSVSAGVRRIEAITADKAEDFVRDQFELVDDLKELLKAPKDLKKTVEDLLNERAKLQKQLEAYQLQQIRGIKEDLVNKIQLQGGVSLIAQKVSLPSADSLKQLAFDLKAKVDNLFLVLAAEIEQKPQIAVMISDNLVKERNWNAGSIVKELAKEIKGGGGGQAFYATAGGIDLSGLDNVIAKAQTLV